MNCNTNNYLKFYENLTASENYLQKVFDFKILKKYQNNLLLIKTVLIVSLALLGGSW